MNENWCNSDRSEWYSCVTSDDGNERKATLTQTHCTSYTRSALKHVTELISSSGETKTWLCSAELTGDGDQAALADVDDVVAADGLGVFRVGVSDQWTDAAPGCQDISSPHWDDTEHTHTQSEGSGNVVDMSRLIPALHEDATSGV